MPKHRIRKSPRRYELYVFDGAEWKFYGTSLSDKNAVGWVESQVERFAYLGRTNYHAFALPYTAMTPEQLIGFDF